ncbi:acriflavin resistance protein [Bacteroides coprosuis DSM 18011]|uniref:Acriflavin resistance protein n=1 Tax=Bacteroides coprosuis DSM 18011 TaxID=679937 RepID=F3ZSV4_9BACE|nr:efflux RND transporter permease subunit [Bacteroides coprosuis]EGJ72195.1 acriflavin resistance protein [Bacteroides coprosuis DSM 18011]
MLNKIIKYFLKNRLITMLILLAVVIWGISTAPFNWHGGVLPSDPVPVDAIPNIGENQQIVATEWMGRSPKDIQDQITYPLTTALLGTPGVKTIRSSSMFGMSTIYVIFEDGVEFYWSRSRILEKLNSLPTGTLPEGVTPTLGPDATALGQIYWYTLEGRNPETGKPNGGWNPSELRTIQDFQVKYALASAEGVSEVASVGGFIKEYQVEIDPDRMRAFNITIMDVMDAIKKSNQDIGAETTEINKVEYLVRGLGYIKKVEDLEEAVVTVREGVPVKVKDVAFVNLGPATRRGGLDKEGVEAVGGVIVARYGSNPMQVINNVKEKIEEMNTSLPQKVLEDGSVSKVSVVPFYDRTRLIQETVGTLEEALSHEVLISIIVVIVLVINLRASIIISSVLPIAVLATFIIMRYTGIEANIVALSGIAIAIGVMVDVGVVLVENILRHMHENPQVERKGKAFVQLIYDGVSEVSGALTTAMLTTIVSFLPVFAMQAQEGKLFKPLAFTKTYALGTAFILGIILIPTIAYFILGLRIKSNKLKKAFNYALVATGIVLAIAYGEPIASALILLGINNLMSERYTNKNLYNYINVGIVVLVAIFYLTMEWLPIGTEDSLILNFVFVLGIIGVILAILWVLVIYYERILHWCLDHRWKFMMIPTFIVVFGITIWLGFDSTFNFIAKGFETIGWKEFRQTSFWKASSERFPGIGEEFMPSLNEGSFLLMPVTMPHTGIEQNQEMIALLDKRIQNIPEVEITVGKWGRVNSALDPAPTQMFENTISYYSEYKLNENGNRQRFKIDKQGAFVLIDGSTYHPQKNAFRIIPTDSLVPDKRGNYFRQWRSHIHKADDIWQEIVNVSHLPGMTASPKLQPIEARLVMLSTGMRAPIGLKVSGPDLEAIEEGGKALETALKGVPSVIPSTVFYDRAVGAPYIEIKLDRQKMARFGITVADLQEVISSAVGGMKLTTTVEGRERFPVRLRYPRELRESPEDLGKIFIPTGMGAQIPLSDVADIQYSRGAQMIQSENTFLIGYVIFDKIAGKAEVDVVQETDKYLKEKIASGELILPEGVSYAFAGNYEQQAQAAKRLLLVIPLSLIIILLILYFQFKTITASFIHFSGVIVAFAGGFILLWLYGEPWFMNFTIGDMNMRDLFQMHPINLSIAVWVGFIALFGISTNDGVIMGTYIHDTFERLHPNTPIEIRDAVVIAGKKRVRPAAMTTATTLIALLPVLTSTGKGADIMVPMAIPTFGGMLIQSMTMFVIPVFQCWWRESIFKRNQKKQTIKYDTFKK